MSENLVREAVEKSTLQMKVIIGGAVIGILMTVVNFFLTREISSTANKIDDTNKTLTELSTTVKIQQVRSDFQNERVLKLEQAREEDTKTHKSLEQRLNSLEQRQALTDQFMQTAKYR